MISGTIMLVDAPAERPHGFVTCNICSQRCSAELGPHRCQKLGVGCPFAPYEHNHQARPASAQSENNKP